MEIPLSPSEIEVLRELQRNLAGSSDYARVTCILMLCMGNSPSFVSSCLGIDVSTVYRYRSSYLHGGVEADGFGLASGSPFCPMCKYSSSHKNRKNVQYRQKYIHNALKIKH